LLLNKQSINSIEIYKPADLFLQLTSALNVLKEHPEISNIIDIDFYDSPYPQYLNRQVFEISGMAPFSLTPFYQFFYCWGILKDQQKNGLMATEDLHEILNNETFRKYYKYGQEVIKAIEDGLVLGLKYIEVKSIDCRLFQDDFKKIIHCADLKSLQDFIKNIDLQQLTSTHYDQVLQVFYTIFLEMEQLTEFIVDPSIIFTLFLERLSNQCVRYNLEDKHTDRILIDGPDDSRNMNYQHVLFLNLSEGYVPSAKKQQFLFTEKQRKLLGLKNYDDVVLREKYYFFRLILCAEKAYLFGIENKEKNMILSSFIEELRLYLPEKIREKETIFNEEVYRLFLQNCSLSTQPCSLDAKAGLKDDLPLSMDEFPDNSLALSYTAFNLLAQCPFQYYLQQKVRLVNIRDYKKNEKVQATVIGNIAHELMSLISSQLEADLNKGVIDIGELYQKQQKSIKDLLNRIFVKYRNFINDVYREPYLREILAPLLLDSIDYFFSKFLPDKLRNRQITALIPEKTVAGDEDKQLVRLAKTMAENKEFLVYIKARADLRLELEGEEAIIIDYKTGNTMSQEQLDFYELFYYLLNPQKKNFRVRDKIFYNVIDNKAVQYGETKLQAEEMVKCIQELLESKHYAKAKRKSNCLYCPFKELCRESD
ncbi:MAG: PD-(D/E)XK nuclease family protein, partial [Candidatus Margulisbacteria bacterium]|nr:PD-(D/E)XK nuclease family protein [Candidatus Margulisiibacteriota bacterium]